MKDKKISELIELEIKRQKEGIELIPSENYASAEVRNTLSSYYVNKYSEGYPKKRYYGGNENVDKVEIIAQERVKKLFGVVHANVQPYSGSPANFAVYLATCKPGDAIMGLNLPDGGHLTHGWNVSATALFYNSHSYHVKANGQIDMDEVRKLAKKYKPKLIWAGATAYSFKYDYKSFAEIADEVGAYFAADIAHVAGLIVGDVHPSPVPYAHIVTTTTHKTLRGPRGGIIMVTKKGIIKDEDLPTKIDRAVFPGLQGGPHDNQTAAIAVALYEASLPSFKSYAKQIIKNAAALADSLKKGGLTLVSNGTENHMMRIDFTPQMGPGAGVFIETALNKVGLTLNKNTVPNDAAPPYYPSGVRLGTPAATTRGMSEKEMRFIGETIVKVFNEVKEYRLPKEKLKRHAYVLKFKKEISKSDVLKQLKKEVCKVAIRFPIP